MVRRVTRAWEDLLSQAYSARVESQPADVLAILPESGSHLPTTQAINRRDLSLYTTPIGSMRDERLSIVIYGATGYCGGTSAGQHPSRC